MEPKAWNICSQKECNKFTNYSIVISWNVLEFGGAGAKIQRFFSNIIEIKTNLKLLSHPIKFSEMFSFINLLTDVRPLSLQFDIIKFICLLDQQILFPVLTVSQDSCPSSEKTFSSYFVLIVKF